GVPLRARLRGARPISLNDVASVIRGCTSSLTFAHAVGGVHRAISPDTIVVEQDLARAVLLWSVSTFRTATGQAPGQDYLAPEELEGGSVNAATDVYYLGALM